MVVKKANKKSRKPPCRSRKITSIFKAKKCLFSFYEIERAREKMKTLQLVFARRAAAFNNLLDVARGSLAELLNLRTIKEIQQLFDSHVQFKQTLREAEEEHIALIALMTDVQNIARQYEIRNGTETAFTAADITNKWRDVKQMILHITEEVLQKFDKKAYAVDLWIKRQIDSVTAIVMGMQDSLEDKLNKLKQFKVRLVLYRPHIDELEKFHEKTKDSLIFESQKNCTHNRMERLRGDWDQLFASIHRYINEVENQIWIRGCCGIAEEEVNEFRMPFIKTEPVD